MTPVELSRTVLHAVRCAVDAGDLAVDPHRLSDLPRRVSVAPPGPGGHGDYATNVALQLARPAGQPPLRVAEVLRPHLAHAPGIRDVQITGPGFLNIRLDRGTGSGLVQRVLAEGLRYGYSDLLAGRVFALRVPYDVRAEVLADSLSRIVASQGGRVEVQHEESATSSPPSRPLSVADGTLVLRPLPAPEDPAPLGPDAARWALLHPAPHDRPRISADHLVQRESNPLFRVRYAHARTRAVHRNAADLGFEARPADADLAPLPTADADLAPLPTADVDLDTSGPAQTTLLRLLADHPRLLSSVVPADATRPDPGTPSRLTRHLVTLADAVIPFLPTVLPRGAEKPSAAHRARLALADAVGSVLAGGLSLLGIDAPDHL
ncbi:DALR anticodon-binding domain-containing protein [Streptomyces longwoodensis]|uniref:ArgS-related anticodon-binding protein NrtL n=1 Tax=Streptomyces longwoodensis TaxID=68231 RepID=UPI002DDA8E8A|nr:DALR anticodon-binding domain-containing protein [Streptomyces longwoodensis]WRY90666.1 DALR anticodon-binding domain-containing protein [Streptomyces longwoodensis]